VKRILKRKKAVVLLVIALAIVLVPYLWSRICSTANQIQVFEGVAEAKSVATDSIRVACYNIAHGRGLAESNWDGGDAATRLKRLDDIAELLRKLDADVLVLNEVDFDASWSNRVNQAAYLADKAGYRYRVEERNLDFRVLHRTWKFGNAILSKYPISNAEVIDLPSYAGIETVLAGKKRGVACDVKVGGRSVRVMGLHLSHRSEDIRAQSAAKVVELVKRAKLPVVIMGDLNSTPSNYPFSSSTDDQRNAIKTFDDSELFVRDEPELPIADDELTFRSDQPKSIIDWIFVSKVLSFDAYSVVTSVLSDHRPVVADISWQLRTK
jgi:endonuclease/exonuclease/phosphatase family metal-dependent hydrolase